MTATLNDALASMRQAMQMLDNAGAPSDVGAHLDLAVARLEETIAIETPAIEPRMGRSSGYSDGKTEH